MFDMVLNTSLLTMKILKLASAKTAECKHQDNWRFQIHFFKQIGCFCLSEAGSGSDAFGMKAVAKKDGDDFIINANKLWITNSGHAGLFLVFANAKPELIKENPKEVYIFFEIKVFECLWIVMLNVLK